MDNENPPQKTQKTLIILVLIVVLVALGVVLVWYSLKRGSENANASANVNASGQSNTFSNQRPRVLADTRDWITYKVANAGYEIANPDSWYLYVVEHENGAGADIDFSVGTFPEPVSIMGAGEESDVSINGRTLTNVTDLEAFLAQQEDDHLRRFPGRPSAVEQRAVGGEALWVWIRDTSNAQDIAGSYAVLYYVELGEGKVVEITASSRFETGFEAHQNDIIEFVASVAAI